jgi:hypothetical protein
MQSIMRALAFCITAWIAYASTAAAQTSAAWMGDEQIKGAFAGVTISGIYGDGMTFTESYGGDGRIAYTDPKKSMTGRWSVVNQSFCTLYDKFVTGGCFRVAQPSSNCFEFYFLTSSEAEAAQPRTGRPSWTARGWDKSKPSTCDEKPAV